MLLMSAGPHSINTNIRCLLCNIYFHINVFQYCFNSTCSVYSKISPTKTLFTLSISTSLSQSRQISSLLPVVLDVHLMSPISLGIVPKINLSCILAPKNAWLVELCRDVIDDAKSMFFSENAQ